MTDEKYTNYSVALISVSALIFVIAYMLGKAKISFAVIFAYIGMFIIAFTFPQLAFFMSVPLILLLYIKHRADVSSYFGILKSKLI